MITNLIDNLERVEIILASASPRRYALLKQMGLEFKVVPSEAEEDHILRTDFEDLVQRNALNKGRLVAQKYPNALVISADTIVVCDNVIMGKPQNEEDAFRMLQALSGRTHRVYTGVGLFRERYEQQLLEAVCTKVRFRALSEEEIRAYIDTGEPFDKAGGYGIQGQGAMLVESIDGCYYNVVGLPVAKLFVMLKTFMRHFTVS